MQQEIDRKYRLSKQMLAMHHSLSDSYRFKAKIAEIVLLAASVIFLATTFADEQLFNTLGLTPELSKVILAITSVFTFFCSLTLLLLDWPEKAAIHKKSAEKWSKTLLIFRNSRSDESNWSDEKIHILNQTYEDASDNTANIPDNKFNKLKAQYILKVEISKLISKCPGTPRLLLWSIVRLKGIFIALRELIL